jgi:malate dehydrogenase (oxaloacetate-decarboxylating)(NADP+)
VLKAYNIDHLEFGRDYVVPKPLDRRVCLWEAPAVAEAAMQTGVARLKLDLNVYRHTLENRLQKK